MTDTMPEDKSGKTSFFTGTYLISVLFILPLLIVFQIYCNFTNMNHQTACCTIINCLSYGIIFVFGMYSGMLILARTQKGLKTTKNFLIVCMAIILFLAISPLFLSEAFVGKQQELSIGVTVAKLAICIVFYIYFYIQELKEST